MKAMALSFLLVLCLAPISLAQEPAKPENEDQASLRNAIPDADSAQLKSYDRDSLRDGDTYCAFMRTYRVKREQRGSDAVTPAGYKTCVPTRRFELRSAVQEETEAPPSSRVP